MVIGWATSPVVGWSGGGRAKLVGGEKGAAAVVVLSDETEKKRWRGK